MERMGAAGGFKAKLVKMKLERSERTVRGMIPLRSSKEWMGAAEEEMACGTNQSGYGILGKWELL